MDFNVLGSHEGLAFIAVFRCNFYDELASKAWTLLGKKAIVAEMVFLGDRHACYYSAIRLV